MAMQSEMQEGRLNPSETLSIQSREINNRRCDTVDAKELHAFLGVGRDFSNWIKARFHRYKFEEGVDYLLIPRMPKRACENRGASSPAS